MSQGLLEKYRPSTLGDVLGQPAVTRSLKLYVKDPYPVAMLFHGDSGVGKTSAAYALARDLGVEIPEGVLGGFFEIASGEQTAQAVRDLGDRLRFTPLFGSKWRVVVVNEADRMRSEAESLWLDVLEHLPPRTVILFTTNQIERLSRRFRDRWKLYHFTSDTEELAGPIRDYVRKVWAAEGLPGEPPDLDRLGMPTLGEVESMHASFRLALGQLARLIREARHGGDLDA